MPRQPDFAALSADLDRVRIVDPRAMQRARDVLADVGVTTMLAVTNTMTVSGPFGSDTTGVSNSFERSNKS